MKLFDSILLNSIYLLFPFSIYLILSIRYKNLDKKTSDVLFEVAVFSSLYLLFKHGRGDFYIYYLALFNIPLLITYLKGKNKTAIVVSLLLILYYHNNTEYSYQFFIFEYVIYYVIYNLNIFKKSSINIITSFVVIKAFLLSMYIFIVYGSSFNAIEEFFCLVISMMIFTIISYFCLFLLEKAEETLKLNDVLNELEKEKELKNSIFKITHEIKNPIAVCKGYLDMIDYEDTIKTKKYIPIVKRQIKDAVALMDDFLDYTKIKIEVEEVDIYMLLDEVCQITSSLFKEKNIKLDVKIPDEEVYLDLDYSRIRQVLVNILKNSIEAKDSRKDNNYVQVRVKKTRDKVVIRIKDNGIGMSDDTLKKVGEMFYTTKERGTGLGVALSKQIIKLHGGELTYNSCAHKWTVVSVILPRKK